MKINMMSVDGAILGSGTWDENVHETKVGLCGMVLLNSPAVAPVANAPTVDKFMVPLNLMVKPEDTEKYIALAKQFNKQREDLHTLVRQQLGVYTVVHTVLGTLIEKPLIITP